MGNAVATNNNAITFNTAPANLEAYFPTYASEDPMTGEVIISPSKVKSYAGEKMTHYVVEGEILNFLFGKPSLGETFFEDPQFFKTEIKNNPMTDEEFIITIPDRKKNHDMDAFKSAWGIE